MVNFSDTKEKRSVAGKIFFFIVVAIVAAIYLTFIVRIILTRDSDETKVVYFSEHARTVENQLGKDSKPFEVYSLSPRAVMTSDGLFQMRFITYLLNSDELEVTVKYARKVPTSEDDLFPFAFELTDGAGVNYTQYYKQEFVTENYLYVRLCFSDVHFDFEQGTPMYLFIHDKNDIQPDKPIVKFTIYDKSTTADVLRNYKRKNI